MISWHDLRLRARCRGVGAVALLGISLWTAASAADGQWRRVEVRPEVYVPLYIEASPGATATLILLPGGEGGLGRLDPVTNKPTSGNFLIRSGDLFVRANVNVVMMSRPTDRSSIADANYRTSGTHAAEVMKVVALARETLGKPVWLVGTSLGTLTAANAAIRDTTGAIAGIVLTASITRGLRVALPMLDLEAIKVPVLMVHHDNDACDVSRPSEVGAIFRRLAAAPIKSLVMISSGREPAGPVCEAMHWHGFINAEEETVRLIVGWIENPRP
jgi:pimeloyl-ACP methyl ester carboxylesterase